MLFDPICALFPCKQGVGIYRHAVLNLHNQGRVVQRNTRKEKGRECLKCPVLEATGSSKLSGGQL